MDVELLSARDVSHAASGTTLDRFCAATRRLTKAATRVHAGDKAAIPEVFEALKHVNGIVREICSLAEAAQGQLSGGNADFVLNESSLGERRR